ncbi:MAG: hypothetical protein Tsb009_10960 [Planctomycetaceae bacterium]
MIEAKTKCNKQLHGLTPIWNDPETVTKTLAATRMGTRSCNPCGDETAFGDDELGLN